MIDSIYRYWLIPSSLRRSWLLRLAVFLLCAGFAAWLTTIPLLIWLPRKTWHGWDGFAAEFIYMLCLLVISVLLTCAVSLTIAPERDRQTWESLVVSSYGMPAIVRAKLIARMLRCSIFLCLLVPFFVAWAYEALTINGAGPADPASSRYFARMTLYLSWLGLRLIGHVLPYVSLGVLISSFSRRGRTALSLAIVANIGYVALLWGLSSIPFPESVQRLFPVATGNVILWPFLPPDWLYYESGSIVSSHWLHDASADVIWMILIPIACYFAAVRRCNRSLANR